MRLRALRGASNSLIGSTFIYAVISGARSAIALLMLPLYTRAVSPAEYGQLAIAWVIASLLTGLLTFGLEGAVTRWYFNMGADPDRRATFIASAWKFLLVVPNLIAMGIWLVLAGSFRSSVPIPTSFLLVAALQSSLYISAATIALPLLRAERRIGVYALVNGIFIVVSVVATTALLFGTDIGAIGWLVGNLIATVAFATATFYLMRSYFPIRFSRVLVLPALGYGIPLLPHILALWALALVDRLILQAYRSSTDVGIYNLAYTISTILVILVVAANQGTMVEFGRAIRDEVARLELRRVVTLQIAVTVALAASIALLGPVLVAILLPESYRSAAGYIGWLALGNLAYCLYLLPMNGLTIFAGKTRWAWLATAAAAVTNVTFNVVLIPRMGIAGAAYATVIGYGVLLLAMTALARRFQPHAIYDWPMLAAIGVGAALAYVGGVLTGGPLDAQSFAIRALWLIAPILVLTLFLWRRHDPALAEATPA